MAAACVRGRNFPQFDGHVLAGRNCGVSVARALIHFGMHGTVKPSAAEVRRRMGGTTDWTNPADVKKAVESYDREAKARGFKPLKYKTGGTWYQSGGVTLIAKGGSRASLLARVKHLEMVQLVVDYGVVNDLFPALSGSSGFRERHSIWIGGGTKKKPGWRRRKGVIEVRLADPTWGRVGTPTATPKWVQFGKIWKMTDGAWSDRGGTGWAGGSVACSPLLPEPPPPVEPEDPCEDVVSELEARLDEALETQAEMQAVIDELMARRLPRALVDRLVALTNEIDAAVPVIDDDSPVEDGTGPLE